MGQPPKICPICKTCVPHNFARCDCGHVFNSPASPPQASAHASQPFLVYAAPMSASLPKGEPGQVEAIASLIVGILAFMSLGWYAFSSAVGFGSPFMLAVAMMLAAVGVWMGRKSLHSMAKGLALGGIVTSFVVLGLVFIGTASLIFNDIQATREREAAADLSRTNSNALPMANPPTTIDRFYNPKIASASATSKAPDTVRAGPASEPAQQYNPSYSPRQADDAPIMRIGPIQDSPPQSSTIPFYTSPPETESAPGSAEAQASKPPPRQAQRTDEQPTPSSEGQQEAAGPRQLDALAATAGGGGPIGPNSSSLTIGQGRVTSTTTRRH